MQKGISVKNTLETKTNRKISGSWSQQIRYAFLLPPSEQRPIRIQRSTVKFKLIVIVHCVKEEQPEPEPELEPQEYDSGYNV